MALSESGSRGGARAGINVTPLVDVVLVLLIIFLVAMPIVMSQIAIEIPKNVHDPSYDAPDQVTVEVTRAGVILLSGVEIDRTELATRLREKLELRREKFVFVDFDAGTRYGAAVSIMDTVRGAGASTVAMKMKPTTAPASGP